MKSNPIFTSLIIFFVLIVLGVFTGSFIVRDRLDHIVYGNKFLQIDGQYESEVIAQYDNLSTITIHMKNPALENTGNISFQIFESDKLIREVGFTGKNIGDPGDVKLKFDPITDSGGKSYQAKLTAEINDPKLSVFVDDEDRLGRWFYYRNKNGLGGLFETNATLVQRMFSDVVFLLLWGGSIVIVFFLYTRLNKSI